MHVGTQSLRLDLSAEERETLVRNALTGVCGNAECKAERPNEEPALSAAVGGCERSCVFVCVFAEIFLAKTLDIINSARPYKVGKRLHGKSVLIFNSIKHRRNIKSARNELCSLVPKRLRSMVVFLLCFFVLHAVLYAAATDICVYRNHDSGSRDNESASGGSSLDANDVELSCKCFVCFGRPQDVRRQPLQLLFHFSERSFHLECGFLGVFVFILECFTDSSGEWHFNRALATFAPRFNSFLAQFIWECDQMRSYKHVLLFIVDGVRSLCVTTAASHPAKSSAREMSA